MARRHLSFWLPRLGTDAALRQRPELRRRLLVSCVGNRHGLVVVAVSRSAEAAGLHPGLTLADARALEPGLEMMMAAPDQDAARLDHLAEWCLRYTPWVAVDGADGLLLDITGCAHLLGGESPLAADLTARLTGFGFEVRVAIADTPAAAWALARYGEVGTIVAPAQQRSALAGLPVAALRLDPATATGLTRVGLRRIGDLFELPRASVAARFGPSVGRRLDQALGAEEEPISPHRPVPPQVVRLAFAEPIATAESIAAAVRQLLTGLCAGLLQTGQGLRQLELSCHRADAGLDQPPQVITIGTSRPVRDPIRLGKLLAEKLDRIEPGFGLDVIALAATAVEALAAEQAGLDGIGERADGTLADLADRLGNRLGASAIGRLQPRQSWWPERADRFVPPFAPGDENLWPADRPRPLRLLDHPEPIEAIAPVPDDPPVLFRWRDQVHRIHRADGPERLSPEWWRGGTDDPRDYYRVEDTNGHRFWLYRAGLYQPDQPARWYLHGFFG